MFDSETIPTTDLPEAPTPSQMLEMWLALRRHEEAEEHRQSIAIHQRITAWIYGEAA